MGVIIRRLLCLDLPTAGLVIGYLGVFGGIWEMIEIILSIIYFDEYYEEEFAGTPASEIKLTIYAIMIVLLVVCLLDLLSSILLIQGTNKKSHKMLLPWLFIKGIALGILIPISSLCFLAGIYSIFNGLGSSLIVNSILMMIVLGLYSYLYMVIYSLYCFIRDELQKPHRIDSEALYSNSNVEYHKT